MILKTIKRIRCAPVPAIVVVLFATVISVIICALQTSNDKEMRHYEATYQAIPITLTVTDPTKEDVASDYGYFMISWVLDLFTEKSTVEIIDVSAAKNRQEKLTIANRTAPTEMSLKEYVKDLQIKMSSAIETINGNEYGVGKSTSMLIGLTSLSCDKKLLPENGCEITWYEGYDESIFADDELVCLIPERMAKTRYYDNGNGEAVLYFNYTMTTIKDGVMTVVDSDEYECTLKIVGTYTAGDELSIYCPFPIIEQVYDELGKEPRVDSLSATIADNRRLGEFLEKANLFFMDPSQKDDEIPWGITLINRSTHYKNDFYRYVMDINDEHLADLSTILEESIRFNRFVMILVVILSVISGFLVGFLMIRRRKRDIMLMRMVGESNARVFFGFALEQLICIILGIAIGGAYYKWNPINNLVIFAVAYFIALSLALVIFMSKKLIKNVKEDE